MKEVLMTIGIGIVVLAIIVVLSIGVWRFKRSLHYKFAYQTQVEKAVDKAMLEHVKVYHSVTNE